MWGIRGVVGWWGWDVESPHVLADSFRANKNGCRISRRKDGECGRGEEAGTRGLKEAGGDGEERVREGSIRGRPERNREREAREVKVSAGSSGEDRAIGEGEGHGWELGRAHECAREGRTDSRRRSWVAPESARMGEGVTEHNRGVG